MLHFFRRYQKIFFLFTTVIIVTSFAFFGTYQAFSPSKLSQQLKGGGKDRVVFRALDGKAIKQSYLDEMIHFLAREDWMQFSRIFDSNYLNDGIISKDFLEDGLFPYLIGHFGNHYQQELQERLEKERNYTPYKHPYLSSLTALNVWSLFAPDIPEKLSIMQKAEDPLVSFQDRVDLFLNEKRFPPAFLTQVIRYQENDTPRAPKDPRLMKDVISLFGYHDHIDWFGEQFVNSIAQVVINTAALARQKGYSVSREEALTDLLFKSQKTYEALSSYPDLPFENGNDLFQLYLRYKGLDEATAAQLWEEILLFRRMMQEVGSAALVDRLSLEQFYCFANEKAVVDLYQMTPELRFKTDEEAKLFEAYLDAVALRKGEEIPLDYASIEIIENKAPELVGKRYHLYIASLDSESLQGRVSMKETWDWEMENWESLLKVFPDLAHREGTPFERMESVEKRGKIDAYARSKIVEMHPEWALEAVKIADMRENELFLSHRTQEPLPGITDCVAFLQLLDQETEIVGYTQDQKHYYRILVDERPQEKEVLTFKEAKKNGLLKPVDRKPSTTFSHFLEKYRLNPPANDLAQQWRIEKSEKEISRSKKSFISLDEVLACGKGNFSSVRVDEKEGTFCYQVKDVLVDTTVPMQKWIQAQTLLSKEMRAQFFETILNQLCSKNLSL